MKLTITLEAHEQSIPFEELIKRYIEKATKAFQPETFEEMVHANSPIEIENRKKKENSIREMFKSERANGQLEVTNINGIEIVSIEALIMWAGDKVFLNQKRIRNRKTFLELADERWDELQLAKSNETNKGSWRPLEDKSNTHDKSLPQAPTEATTIEETTQPCAMDSSESQQSLDELNLKKRERQIKAIELAAIALEYDILSIPPGGKAKLMAYCKEMKPELFGSGDESFLGTWKSARKQERVKTENHQKYIPK